MDELTFGLHALCGGGLRRRGGGGFLFVFLLILLAVSLDSTGVMGGQMRVPVDSDYQIDVWETEQGLPENSATSILQTRDGYLWFGTFNGLVRFDGVKFKVFNRENTPELLSSGVLRLHLDSQDRLWVSTYGGITMMERGRWRSFGRGQGWYSGVAHSFAEHGEGMVVTTTDGKIRRFTGLGFEGMQVPEDSASKFFCRVDNGGRLWVVGHRFVGTWTGAGWEERISRESFEEVIEVAASAGDDGLWVGDSKRLRKYLDGRLVKEFGVGPASHGWDLWEDSGGKLWYSSFSKGLFRYSVGGEVTHFTTANGLSYDGVRCVFEDREGNLWVGTSGGGLLRFKQRRFKNYGLEEGLPNRLVRGVVEAGPDEMVVVSFGGGAVRMKGGVVTRLWDPHHGMHGAFALVAMVDRGSRIWVGTQGNGVYRVEGGEVERMPVDQTGGKIVYAIFEDSKGRVWVGGDEAVVLHEGDGKVREFRQAGVRRLGGIRCFAEDERTGVIWGASFEGGVVRYESGEWTLLRGDERLTSLPVWFLHVDGHGALWAGTFGGGLACVRGGEVGFIGQEEGLPARNIGSIMEDDLGHVWLGSNRGVYRVSKGALDAVSLGESPHAAFIEFNQSDGLASIECAGGAQSAAVRGEDGRMWFATLKGLSVIDPAAVRLNSRVPSVKIEDVVVDGVSVYPGAHAMGSEPLELAAGGYFIEIHYTGLSYSAPEKLRFSYRLEGLNDEWVDVGQRRAVYFQHLHPGRYQLRVWAINGDAVWNELGESLRFTLLPKYWQTLGFKVGVGLFGVLLVGGAGWVVSQRMMRSQLAQLRQQRELDSLQARFAAVMENTSDAVSFATPDRKPFYLNRAARTLLGLDASDDLSTEGEEGSLARRAASLVSEEGLSAVEAGEIWRTETALEGRDGETIPVSQVMLAHRSEDGTLDFVSSIARDITDRKVAEAAHRELSQFNQQIISSAGEGIIVYDAAFRIVGWNEFMVRFSGVSAEEAIGKQALELFPELKQQGVLPCIERALGGETVVTPDVFFSLPESGRLGWTSVTYAPNRNADGNIIGVIGVVRDITARKRSERGLRALAEGMSRVTGQEFFRLMAKNLSEAFQTRYGLVVELVEGEKGKARTLAIWDGGQWAENFEYELAGTPCEGVVGQTFRLIPRGVRQEFPEDEVLQQIGVESFAGMPLFDSSQSPIGLIAVMNDQPLEEGDELKTMMTLFAARCGQELERVRAEEKIRRLNTELEGRVMERTAELRSANKEVEAFSYSVSHDLRAPLRNISGFVSLLTDRIGGGLDEESGRYLGYVREETKRMGVLIDDLLALSGLHRREMERVELDLGEVVREVREQFELELEDRRIEWEVGPLGRVWGDAVLLRQVFVNLIGNAIRYTRRRDVGRIEIGLAASEREGETVIYVKDNGAGFNMAYAHKLFGVFQRLHHTRDFEGTGVGLANVQRIVQRHGGRVWGEGEEGVGAVFYFSIPEKTI